MTSHSFLSGKKLEFHFSLYTEQADCVATNKKRTTTSFSNVQHKPGRKKYLEDEPLKLKNPIDNLQELIKGTIAVKQNAKDV